VTDAQRRPTARARGSFVSDEVEQVLSKALAVDPRARYFRCGQFWDALLLAVQRAGSGSVVPAVQVSGAPLPETKTVAVTHSQDARIAGATKNPEQPRHGLSARAWLATALIGVLAVGGLLFTSRPSAPGPAALRGDETPPRDARLLPVSSQNAGIFKAPACQTATTSPPPPGNWQGWPVFNRPELQETACHLAGGNTVSVLCRNPHSVCVEGPDSRSSSRCQGFVHTDAFVAGHIMGRAVQTLPLCDGVCPPIKACELKR